eukprot:1004005_1
MSHMFAGASVLFTGLASIVFLGHRFRAFHWTGLLGVTGGLTLVGISGYIKYQDSTEKSAAKDFGDMMFGNVLILCSQVFAAARMVITEKVLKKHDVPALQASGIEGCFGFGMVFVLLFPFYFLRPTGIFKGIAIPTGQIDNPIDAFAQMGNAPWILAAFLMFMFTTACYNYSGMMVTKTISATASQVLKQLRIIFIWMISIFLTWEVWRMRSSLVQMLGFVFLAGGTLIYNSILRIPCFAYPTTKDEEGFGRQEGLADEVELSEIQTPGNGTPGISFVAL